MAYWASRSRWARQSWRSFPCPACAAERSATHTSGLVSPRKSVSTTAPRLSAIRWWTAVEESSTHCHQFFPSTRAEVSSEATTLLLRTAEAVVSAAVVSGCPGAGQHVGNGALADADTEHFVEQPHQPL